MAHTYAYGGDPNNTNYRTSYSNNFLYSTYGGFPTGHPSSDGGQPVKIFDVGTDWSTGATYHHLNHGGIALGPGSVISTGGGLFQHRVGHGSGTLGAGRNTGNGATLTDSADGDVATGGICGWFTWATVSLAPDLIRVDAQPGGSLFIQFSGNGNTGGEAMTAWQYQVATNSAFTTGVQTIASSGTSTFVGVPGTTYWVRARGLNSVGWSAWSNVRGATAKSGGKVSVGGQWKTGITKVSVGGAWKDAIVKVSVGGAWKDAI